MLIDLTRNTSELFLKIKTLATEGFQRFFDSDYRPPADPSQYDEEQIAHDIVVSMNNRAVISQFKVQTHHLGKRISETDNQRMLDFQQKLFEYACTIDPMCEEAHFNLLTMLWRRGKIFDEQFCDEARRRFKDN